jgi:hypothetical protein
MKVRSSRSVNTLEQQPGAVPAKFHPAQLIKAEQVGAAVAGDGLGSAADRRCYLKRPALRTAEPTCRCRWAGADQPFRRGTDATPPYRSWRAERRDWRVRRTEGSNEA